MSEKVIQGSSGPPSASGKDEQQRAPLLGSRSGTSEPALDVRRRTRERGKCAICCIWTFSALGLAALCGIGYGLYWARAQVHQPHRSLYVKLGDILPGPRPESSKGNDPAKMQKFMFGTEEEQEALKQGNLGKDLDKTWEDDVVRPLFDAKTRFDVHATLWLKWAEEGNMLVNDEQSRSRLSQLDKIKQPKAGEQATIEYSDFRSDRLEHLQPIWSGIVAQNLTLGSTRKSADAEIDIDLSALPLLNAETVKASTLSFTSVMVPSDLDAADAPWSGLTFANLTSADGLFTGDSVWEARARSRAWKRPGTPSSANLQAQRLCQPTMVESALRKGSVQAEGETKRKRLMGWTCHLWKHSRQANSTLGASKRAPLTLTEALLMTGSSPKPLISVHERIEDGEAASPQDSEAKLSNLIGTFGLDHDDTISGPEADRQLATLLGETTMAQEIKKTVAALLLTRSRIMLPKVDEQAIFRVQDLKDKQGPNWAEHFGCVAEGDARCAADRRLSPFHQHFTFTAPDGSLRHFYAPQILAVNGDSGIREILRLFDHVEKDDLWVGPGELMKNSSQVYQERHRDFSETDKASQFSLKLVQPFAKIENNSLAFKWRINTAVTGPVRTHFNKLDMFADSSLMMSNMDRVSSPLPLAEEKNEAEGNKDIAMVEGDRATRESFAEGLFMNDVHQMEEIQSWVLTGDIRRHLTLLGLASFAFEFLFGLASGPLMLLYWLTRRTSFGLSGAAAVLDLVTQFFVDSSVFGFEMSLKADSFSLETQDHPILQNITGAILPTLVAASFNILQAFRTFRITFAPWRRSKRIEWSKTHQSIPYTAGVVGQRKADQAERRNARLDLPYAKVFILTLGLFFLDEFLGNIELTTSRGYPKGYFSADHPPHLGQLAGQMHRNANAPVVRKHMWLAFETLSTSCGSAATICQLLLNSKTKTFNGTFRIAALLSATQLLLNWLHAAFTAENVAPYTVRCVVADSMILTGLVQAVIYRGARQEVHVEELEE
ncbi:hypothetical protein IE81DRAFT_365936 [Ceraceosorus guamensis]|uniref:Uncharacterized protein n=1 Tax=Ceraceosorus guamensis TaxID=1522189 RepID=A0A316W1E4_9BASI|nr:hypothetical protein IE81DRAFT_365936 [Ceraceosorus guamensis]PWN43324.1 hypothetical protein IE81DRAFT_365936 [Ceraceosorus guamensis]